MRYRQARIAALGYELPERVVTSEAIEDRLAPLYQRLGLSVGRLELMTGIRTRRFFEPGETPSAAAARAGERALTASGIARERIGALIFASVCRDYLEPATANVVHHRLGLRTDGLVLDVSNACLGMLNGLCIVADLIELSRIEAGLIVAGELGERLVDATIAELLANPAHDRQSIKAAFASLTIGSGAAAVLLARPGLGRDEHALLGGVVHSDTAAHGLCRSGRDLGLAAGPAPLMETRAEELLQAGCALAARAWPRFLGELGWRAEDVDVAITHQVGRAHRLALAEAIGRQAGEDPSTVEGLGNMGSVSLPITLARSVEQGLVRPGHRVALLGIGSGLNCLMLGLHW